jgi:plastocyanin
MNKFFVSLVILLVSSLVLSGCFSNTNDTAPTPTPASDEDMIIEDEDEMIEEEPSVTPAEETGMEVDKNAVNVTVNGTNFKFEPNVIEAKPGQTVTVTLDVTEGFHDFVIDEIEGAKTTQMNAGSTETITFVVPSDAVTGDSYEYYCSVGQHRQMGMVGTLKVV